MHMWMFWEFFLFLFVLSSFVSWCHGGNTSAVSYFQDSEEAVCDMLEKRFSSTCCCSGMAGNLMSPECVPPKLRILTHRSTIPQLMPSRHRSLSVKCKLHMSVLPHNFCRKIPTKQHLLSVMEIVHALFHCNQTSLKSVALHFLEFGLYSPQFLHCSEKPSQNTSFFSATALFTGYRFFWYFWHLSLLKTNTELKLTSTYKFLFYCVQENRTVEWFDMRRERLLSPSAFGKYGKLSLKFNGRGWFNRLASMQCLASFYTVTLDWLPWDYAEQAFRKIWIRIWEFESILYPFFFFLWKQKWF